MLLNWKQQASSEVWMWTRMLCWLLNGRSRGLRSGIGRVFGVDAGVALGWGSGTVLIILADISLTVM